MSIVQGLLPHTIPRQDKSVLPCIPNGYGKHSAQHGHTVQSELFVEMHDDFRVRS